jgi:hypothetical protein
VPSALPLNKHVLLVSDRYVLLGSRTPLPNNQTYLLFLAFLFAPPSKEPLSLLDPDDELELLRDWQKRGKNMVYDFDPLFMTTRARPQAACFGHGQWLRLAIDCATVTMAMTGKCLYNVSMASTGCALNRPELDARPKTPHTKLDLGLLD